MPPMTETQHAFGPAHVAQYLESNGEEGFHWRRGSTILLLTTKGRKTGEERIMPLIFREDDGRYIVVASRGGSPQHPAWYLNLRDDPEVTVQVRDDRFAARARTAGPDERPRLWELMTEVWPDYDAYQEKTDREIPVVILERA